MYFVLMDGTMAEDLAYLSLNCFCVINNSELGVEFGCCVRVQVESRVHSISVSYHTAKEGFAA